MTTSRSRRRFEKKLDLAGMRDEEAGRLGGAIPHESWFRPKNLRVVGDPGSEVIQYPRPADDTEITLTTARPGLLDGFLALADGSPQSFRKFAARWGVLELCQHGLPRGHPLLGWPVRYPVDLPGAEPEGMEPPWPCSLLYGKVGGSGFFWEPVAVWRAWARRAQGLLRVVAALTNDGKASEEDWRATLDPGVWRFSPWVNPSDPNKVPWVNVMEIAHRWLYVGDVRPCLDLRNAAGTDPGLELELMTNGLFGAIAIQLTLSLVGTKRYARCVECGQIAFRKISPRSDRRAFCESCAANGAPQRWASRSYRAKKKHK